MAVDTIGHLPAQHATDADEQGGAQVAQKAQAFQEVTEQRLEVAFVDEDYTGQQPEETVKERETTLEVVKLPEAKGGFVLLPTSWVVDRSLAWVTRFPRLARE